MARDKSYQDFIHSLAESRENRTFLNSDEEHALDVLIEIFHLSKSKLRIFAGCLCHHVGNNPEYVVAISEYIERGGELYILLNNFDETTAKDSNLYKRLAYYKTKKNPIYIKRTSVHPYIEDDPEKKEVHFTIGDDNVYRIETDIEKRTAECNLNNPEIAKKMAEFFDELFSAPEAQEIDVVTLVDNGN